MKNHSKQMSKAFTVSIVSSNHHSTGENWSEEIEELFLLQLNGEEEEIRLHDYQKLYAVPGLYNHILIDLLDCHSHEFVAELLQKLSESKNIPLQDLRILDLAAGSGLVSNAVQQKGGSFFIGVDIESEAKKAVERDFPNLYNSYQLMNFVDLKEQDRKWIQTQNLNALIVASALGFGEKHVPVEAFIKAFNLIPPGGAIVFCIYDQYLSGSDETGYHKLLDHLQQVSMDIVHDEHYVHRQTTYGTKIWYRAISGLKKANIRLL